MATTKQRAVWYAQDIVCMLWRKTGKRYEVKAYPLGDLKQLDIREMTDDCTGSYRLVISYRTKTWVDMCDQVHAAYETYLAIRNA